MIVIKDHATRGVLRYTERKRGLRGKVESKCFESLET